VPTLRQACRPIGNTRVDEMSLRSVVILFQCHSRSFNQWPSDAGLNHFRILTGFRDGFRSLVYVQDGECRLISRNRKCVQMVPSLSESIPAELQARSAILDGEIVCLDQYGKSQLKTSCSTVANPATAPSTLLWVHGEDLRFLPLIERKWRLRLLLPRNGSHLLYCNHVEHDGDRLFRPGMRARHGEDHL
jgi:hypothetical protein